METGTIAAQNRCIALYIGGVVHSKKRNTIVFDTLFNGKYKWDVNDMMFHKSYEWIMPVVEKIEAEGYRFKICRRRVEIQSDISDKVVVELKTKGKLQSIFDACYTFILLTNYKT